MAQWVRLSMPVAALVALAPAGYAVEYMTLPQAQKLAFPSGHFVELQSGRVWKIEGAGYFFFDRVIGKHLYIDYTVALDTRGRIRRVDILQYRESYGGEVREPSWLAQFVGKTGADPLQVDNDIRNISGATLSSHHLTEGIKRILAAYENHLR